MTKNGMGRKNNQYVKKKLGNWKIILRGKQWKQEKRNKPDRMFN